MTTHKLSPRVRMAVESLPKEALAVIRAARFFTQEPEEVIHLEHGPYVGVEREYIKVLAAHKAKLLEQLHQTAIELEQVEQQQLTLATKLKRGLE